MKTTRTYKGKDVEMLTVCATITQNAIANQEFLASKRKTWETPFFQNLKTRIDKAFADFLGINSAAELKQATISITQIQTQALADLAELKVQIDQDFKTDKNLLPQILKQLGYTDFYKSAKNKDQEALIQLLYYFKTNLTNNLRTQITQKGTDTSLIDQIIAYADNLASLNISQETLKSSKKAVTEIAIIEFNEIYDQVIGITKIAQNFFKGNATMIDQFSYTKIINQLNAAPRKPTNQEPTQS